MSVTIDSPRAPLANAPDADAPVARWRQRRWIALGLFATYLFVSLFVDPQGHLSTDVGGKTASVAAMVDRGDWDPDIGYWFEDHDPDGRFHAMGNTRRTADGTWINTTSLTMVLPARPLWELGGPRAVLLLPMLGSVAAALAAGALARRIRPADDGALVSWWIGLASPVTIYALDFWEHSWGLALMTVGAVGVIDAQEPGSRPTAALLSGVAFGLAATMRQEALVYGLIGGLVLVVQAIRHGGLLCAVRRGSIMAIAAVVPLAAHLVLELSLVGAASRTTRGASTLDAAGSEISERLFAGLATTTFAFASRTSLSWILSLILVGALAAIAVSLARTDTPNRTAVRAVMLAGTMWTLTIAWVGLGFVPGMAIAAPAVIFGLVGAAHARQFIPWVLGVVPIPLVIATAFPNGALPQWGGRYLLTSGLVLSVLGILWLRQHPTTRRGVLAASAVVTLVGVGWTVERTHGVQSDAAQLEAVTEPGDVLVWYSPHRAREFGPLATEGRWLSATHPDDHAALSPLLIDAGVDQVLWIARPGVDLPELGGYSHRGEIGGIDFLTATIHRFERRR